MQFTDEHLAFRDSVRGFVNRHIEPNIEQWEHEGIMPLHELFAAAGNLGMLGLEYDEEYGGQGIDDHAFTYILGEELGACDHGSFPMAIGVQVKMATPSLHAFGSDDLKERYLAPALSGEHVTSIAVTEPDAGSDVAGIRTTARRDGDDWIINGAKMYITNALQADWMCVLARTSDEGGYDGMSQIIVPTDTPGFTVDRKLDKLGMRASDTGLLSFDDVRVPVSNTIGEVGRGFQQQMAQFDVERLWVVYTTVGSMVRQLERTRDYARDRSVFGKPLMANQYWQYQLAELSAEVDLLRVYAWNCVDKLNRGENITREATVAKLKAGRLSRQVTDAAIQLHGGIGYMEETWTARALRDARLAGIAGGADEVMLRVLSRIDGFY